MKGYLDRLNWRCIYFLRSSCNKKVKTNFSIAKGAIYFFLITVIFLTAGHWIPEKKVVHNPYRGVSEWITVTDLEKPLFIQTRIISWNDAKNGRFPEGTEISIVPKGDGRKIGSDLNPIQFALYNAAKSYLSPKTAGDWIFPSRLLNSGKKMTEVLGRKNLAMAFSVFPYGGFVGDIQGTNYLINEPFFKNKGMQGIEKGFVRKFADGSEQLIKPNDTWIFLRPNIHGKNRHTETDIRLGAPSINPEEVLIFAAYTFTDLCNHQTGRWDTEQTKNWVAKQYSIAYGVSISPEKIEIVGKGINARLVHSDPLVANTSVVMQEDSRGIIRETEVSLINRKNELCFYDSMDPTQLVIIPLSFFHKMEKDATILLGVKGEIKESFQDILDEAQQVRDNRLFSKKGFIYPNNGGNFGNSYLANYVVKTPRMREIANNVISGASSRKEAIQRIMDYSAESLAYISDKKSHVGTPREIPMSPMMALLNRGEDCEGHAIFAASLFIAATDPIIGDNSQVGLAEIMYVKGKKSIGHVIALIPGFGNPGLPFPNHIMANGVPFGYFEATGAGYNNLHQLMPQKVGYLPKKIFIIDPDSRNVDVAGFNQFEYLEKGRG